MSDSYNRVTYRVRRTLSMYDLHIAMTSIKNEPTFLVMSKWSRHYFSVWGWKPILHTEVEWKLHEGKRQCTYCGVPILTTDFTSDGCYVLDYNEQFGDNPNTTSIYVIGDHGGKLSFDMEKFTLTRELLDGIEDKVVLKGIEKGEFRP